MSDKDWEKLERIPARTWPRQNYKDTAICRGEWRQIESVVMSLKAWNAKINWNRRKNGESKKKWTEKCQVLIMVIRNCKGYLMYLQVTKHIFAVILSVNQIQYRNVMWYFAHFVSDFHENNPHIYVPWLLEPWWGLADQSQSRPYTASLMLSLVMATCATSIQPS